MVAWGRDEENARETRWMVEGLFIQDVSHGHSVLRQVQTAGVT